MNKETSLHHINTIFTFEFTYVFVVKTSSHRDLVEPLNISNESFLSSSTSSGSLERGQTRLSNIIFSHCEGHQGHKLLSNIGEQVKMFQQSYL